MIRDGVQRTRPPVNFGAAGVHGAEFNQRPQLAIRFGLTYTHRLCPGRRERSFNAICPLEKPAEPERSVMLRLAPHSRSMCVFSHSFKVTIQPQGGCEIVKLRIVCYPMIFVIGDFNGSILAVEVAATGFDRGGVILNFV